MKIKTLISSVALTALTLAPCTVRAQRMLKPQQSAPMLKAQKVPLGRELWANVVQSGRWQSDTPEYGFYSFGASKSIDINELFTSEDMFANAGGALAGNRLDIIRWDNTSGAMIHYYYDATTGELQDKSYLSNYALWSTETAVSADGKVYGVFYSADASAYELGIADYANNTRSTIGTVYNYYVALGITKDNVLYGVDTNANLYRIDATTAKETFVGPTGVKVSNSGGEWNVQSGEIDQNSGIFYWACSDANQQSALYTVDLETGKATKVGDFLHNEQFALLTVPQETVANAAPGLATDMSVDFDKASLTGTVTFKAPTSTYVGSNLMGSLNYVVSVDGNEAASGTANAGQSVSTSVTTKRGFHSFAVVFSNTEGNGPKTYINRFVGDDIPAKPTNVKAKVDIKTGKVTLSWDAVTEGINGGYVSDITYNVKRYPDNKTIATTTTATSVDDNLPTGTFSGYYYMVQAVSGQRKSEQVKSNSVSFGNVLEPPFSEGFDSESAMNLFTIVDANNDGNTWSFCDNDGGNNSCAQMVYGDVNHDDWLITPPLSLKAGVVYNITYRVASKGVNYPEMLEVMYGDEPTAEAMTHELSKKEEITNQQYVTVKKELSVDEDQVVYFGFHCTSDANWCYQLVLDDISVTGNSLKAPDAITEITVTPTTDGTTKARIDFVAPTKAIDGTTLTSSMDVRILNNGEEVQEMSNIEPGKSYYYIDGFATNGYNSYTLIASNNEGTGRESKAVEAYCGPDTPNSVENIKVAIGDSNITLTWDPVTTGEHGGYLSTDDMVYNVYNIVETSTGVNLPLEDQVSEPRIVIPYDLNSGNQDMINYALSAENGAGEGPRVMSPGILVGKPYDLPFEEHFKGGALDNSMWWITSTGGSTYQLMQGFSADGDGGCAGYVSTSSTDSAILGSGKIALNGAKNPTLVFSTKSTSANATGKVVVNIRKPDLSEQQLCVVDYSNITNADKDWHITSVSIPAEYASLPYFTLTFVTSASAGETVYFDQIYVRDVVAKDLSATLSSSSRVRKGDKVTAHVNVTNKGSVAADNYTVNLYVGDKLVDTKAVQESLASYASRTETLTYKTSVVDASPLTLKAEVVIEGESTPDDNVATAEVQLTSSTLQNPEKVTVNTSDGSNFTVEWEKVSETAETVTDDFEKYAKWSMDDFGDWTSVYGEKGIAKGPFSNSYPHPDENERFAYAIAEPATWLTDEVLASYPCLKPHSGNHYLAAFYSVENSQFIVADNWLISPSLTGEAQTISFWANNFKSSAIHYPENFEVLYSTSGITLDDFKSLDKAFVAEGGEWKEYTVALPEGATYFAIHNNTADTYMFMIDDVTYVGGSGKVLGYNVYRDKTLIKTVAPDADNYIIDKAPSGKHTYAVSALYAGGESEATKAYAITAINGIENAAANAPFDVYTVDGKRVASGVKSLDSMKRGFYVVNGKKVVRK